MSLITYHTFSSDLSPADTWRLLRWCLSKGADEFSLSLMSMEDSPEPLCDAFRATFAPWERSKARRAVLVGADASDLAREVPLWQLTPAGVDLLPSYFPAGLLEYRLTPTTGWVEDPLFYRQGSLMFGVVSHEQEGLLRVEAGEHAELGTLGLVTRPHGQWLAY